MSEPEELQLTVFTYGPKERRVEIEIRPPVPNDIKGDIPLVQEWAKKLSVDLFMDMKHTNNWECSTCGKPSRETKVHTATWTHLSPPRMVLYIYHLCSAGRNYCHQVVIDQSNIMRKLSGFPPEKEEFLSKPKGVKYPLAASCLGCRKDATARPDAKLKRCGRCKLVRYCGTGCQLGDWSRHKMVCRHVKSVKWVNWD